ncbi:MAG: flotillin family protein [Proteobacteria bacterium]|nr:flotillin family protein [Pseudomonadota bacterium]MBU1138323.1 flotillin family protein [Pseudomonadota bacterium]MBU1231976.1 flotillin family protein [Pseudomonadota bacterium]MBU1418999.1 flotillin family protein [Pseudomonadota bacterium]MBU1455073.1 flotillin family protein [Pseudomonadota bacterium]
MGQLTFILTNAAIILIALLTVGFVLARLYKRSSKEVSFVRTGFRGQKVILNGGAIVLPVLHEIIPVNMNTLRLEVKRENQQALITRDRMRVDVMAEFYVRVKPTEESIANAAQTLGMKTMNPSELKELVEGKFVDSLRAVAAEMAMEELHEQRVDFVNKVQSAVSEDLLKNGLELESVSLTGMDQTSKEFFNPDNAFDAEGLTRLTQEIEERRKIRNDIEMDTQVAIETKNLEAQRQQLEIAKEKEYAELHQQRELEIRRATQAAEIAQEKALKRQQAEQAGIEADKQIKQSTIAAEQAIETDNILREQIIKEKDILKNRTIETAQIEQAKTIELAEQDKAIAIAEKSKAKSLSEAEADKARALAMRESERVITVQETEKAERIKAVELVQARKIAEREAISVQVAAEAEKIAALDTAEAITTTANAEASKKRIEASGEAEAEKLRAAAAQIRYQVDAEGEKALNEARNMLSNEQIAMQIRLDLIKHLPEIIKESVKPMEHIDGIKIIQVDGLNNSQSLAASGDSHSEHTGNLSDQLVNSALRYRGQAPLIDSLLADIGLKGDNLNSLTDILKPDQG